jgi:hypothetical protein
MRIAVSSCLAQRTAKEKDAEPRAALAPSSYHAAVLVARPPILPALVATIALVLIAREPSIVFESEHDDIGFGVSLAAAGPHVATLDGERGPVTLRVDRVVDGKLVPEARLLLTTDHRATPIAAHDDTIAALAERELVILHVGQLPQTIPLSDVCYYASAGLHLGDALIVVEGYRDLCIFERVHDHWVLTSQIPHEPGHSVTVSKHRIVVGRIDHVVILERSTTSWRETSRFDVPRWTTPGLSASDRWLVMSSEGHTHMIVRDLDASARIVAMLLLPDRLLPNRVALDDHTIAIGDGERVIRWRFTAGAWRGPEALAAPGDSWSRGLGVGDFTWVAAHNRVYGFE